MTINDLMKKFKKEYCAKCVPEDRKKCEGISITLDGKARCIKKNIVE